MTTQEFEFTDDFVELRKMTRRFCEEFSPESAVRKSMESETGYDASLWRRLGSELGVLGLSVPEEFDGADVGLVAQAVVVDELGAALFCGPVVGTLFLAVPALCAVADEQVQKDYLPGLVAGETVATVAVLLEGGVFEAAAVTVTAQLDDGQWRLSGTVEQVPDGLAAELILVAAQTEAGVSLFAVAADAAGLSRSAVPPLDLTRRQARVVFDNVDARRIADDDEAPDVLSSAIRTAAVLMSVDAVGGSQRLLDLTVDHVSTRFQFGQPVGANQAVKHRCANMLVELEQARSAVYHAAWSIQDGTDDAQLVASLAQAVAIEAYLSVSRSAIQMHGGLGFTWEGSTHLYYKRATTDSAVFGRPELHLDRIAHLELDTIAAAV